ncbi:hypothetical protein GOV09_01610 [Candidatus Woesearchaeota archaeon]|nr:hypothetical protein [Candidatus Woesearchaeota archaeon]
MKKAQQAVEFLMNYGWALIIFLLIVAVLTYAGVLNWAFLSPRTCIFPAGISCRDFEIRQTDDEIAIAFKNSLGADITDVSIFIPGCVGDGPLLNIKNDDRFIGIMTDCPVTDGVVDTPAFVRYTNIQSGLTFTVEGHLQTRVGWGKQSSSIGNDPVSCPVPLPVCRDGNIEDNACIFTFTPESQNHPACTEVCDGSGNCVECTTKTHCATKFIGTDDNWECIDYTCVPVPLAQGEILSVTIQGAADHWFSGVEPFQQNWKDFGYAVFVTEQAAGCLTGSNCGTIEEIRTTCWNDCPVDSGQDCMQIAATIAETPFTEAVCAGTGFGPANANTKQDCTLNEEYFIYENPCACFVAWEKPWLCP